MLTRLTRTRRWRAARLLAFVYLFCVVAPAASFALADGPRAMPCLTEDASGVVHAHDAPAAAQPVHSHGAMHDHAAMSQMAMAQDENAAVEDVDAGHGVSHKTSAMPCCSMSCPGALPATLPEVRKPPLPTTLCVSVTQQRVADNAPPRLYRPPIS